MKKSTLSKTGVHVLLLWMAIVPPSFAISAFDALHGPEPALPNERVIYVPGDTSVESAQPR